MTDRPALTMSFDPNTIEHLGVRMYSTLPPVIAELIANSYDADATKVAVQLHDNGDKMIVVEDNGIGMTIEEINQKFLRIGRDRRTEEQSQSTPAGRLVIGKKGLGKLSFFGIAKEIEIATRKDGKETVFVMKWDDIKAAQHDYSPTIQKLDVPCGSGEHGTTITLRQIGRVTDFSAEDLASSLAKIFIIPETDFSVTVQRNSEDIILLDNERKFEDIETQFQWEVPHELKGDAGYDHKDDVRGVIIASKKPISPKTNMRGIVLYSRKKLVNVPDYFSDNTSSHFYSYLTGWLEVDFVDDLDEDVISTDRKSLKWDHPEMVKLREYLRSLIRVAEQDWRKRRTLERERGLAESTGIDVPDWLSKVPAEIRAKLTPIVETIVNNAELSDDDTSRAVSLVHDIVPEYPTYHWRHLHAEVKSASEADYKNEDYYRAFQEASKRYINAVKAKSGSTNSSEASMMGEVFGAVASVPKATTLLVAQTFSKPDGTSFQPATIANIEDGQKYLSMGVVSGCRNPVSHEEVANLRDSGLFTDKDCLDALSLLSHLFSRLDNA